MTIPTSSTWSVNPGSSDYNTFANWGALGVPGPSDTGFFGTSTVTNLSISADTDVGEWFFNPGASQYIFTISGHFFNFTGGGIVINGGSANVMAVSGADLEFFNDSSAGSASITCTFSEIDFRDGSTAASANIKSNKFIDFVGDSSAGTATIHTLAGGQTIFGGFSTGGNAQLITDSGGQVDFSFSAGPANNHALSIGSIAGGGTYFLGGDRLTVGSNGLPSNVAGAVDDGGIGGGSGASLVKVGHDTLTLSRAGNTYSGGTTIEQGKIDLAAVGAAGTGAVAFAGRATLKIENTALSGHTFGNPIEFFAKHDVLDLSGLHFHAGATAIYHKASHHLTVHSGGVTDTLTLLSPHGKTFTAANDGHGGTKVVLDPPHGAATVAALATHDLVGEHWASDTITVSHIGDYLFTA